MGKEENASYQNFSSSSTMFSKAFILRVDKIWDCVVVGGTSNIFTTN